MSIHKTGTVGGHPGGGFAFNDYCGNSNEDSNFGAGTGIFVKTIQTWTRNDPQGVHGIQFSFWNGYTAPIRGSRIGSSNVFHLERNDRIRECVLWGNGVGTRCGRLKLVTNEGRTFEVGKNVSGQDSFQKNVYGGFLCGGYGRGGADIDHLGFVFFGEIESMVITNLTYTKPLDQFGNITRVELDSATWDNTSSNSPLDWEFTNSVTKERSWELTSSTSATFGIGISISAEIPLVATVGTEYKFELTHVSSSTTSVKESQTLSWKTGGTLQPGNRVQLEALTAQGTMNNLPYTCSVEARVDGRLWMYTDKGVFKSVSYSRAYVRSSSGGAKL